MILVNVIMGDHAECKCKNIHEIEGGYVANARQLNDSGPRAIATWLSSSI